MRWKLRAKRFAWVRSLHWERRTVRFLGMEPSSTLSLVCVELRQTSISQCDIRAVQVDIEKENSAFSISRPHNPWWLTRGSGFQVKSSGTLLCYCDTDWGTPLRAVLSSDSLFASPDSSSAHHMLRIRIARYHGE